MSPLASCAGFSPRSKATEANINQAGIPVLLQYLNDCHKIIMRAGINGTLQCAKHGALGVSTHVILIIVILVL